MTQYTLHADKIVQGTVLTLTFVLIILSLTMKYEICCPKDKDSDKEPEINSREEDEKPTCYCVWNNKLGMGIMTIILFFLMVCAIFAPEEKIYVDLFSGTDIKNLFVSIFSTFTGGFKKFTELLKDTLGPLAQIGIKILMGILLFGGLIW